MDKVILKDVLFPYLDFYTSGIMLLVSKYFSDKQNQVDRKLREAFIYRKGYGVQCSNFYIGYICYHVSYDNIPSDSITYNLRELRKYRNRCIIIIMKNAHNNVCNCGSEIWSRRLLDCHRLDITTRSQHETYIEFIIKFYENHFIKIIKY